jgi:Zn-dependent membrane protease YugP
MRTLKWLGMCVVAAGLAGGAGVACQSTTQQGVKSNLHSQWTDVNASTQATAEAARAVFEDEGLKDVKSNSTNVDGTATAKMADGTKVSADVKKVSGNTSQVSVTVGTVGDPKLGAELAKKIKLRAENGA